MTSGQRVAAAFSHERPDRIPIYQAGFSSFVASYVLGRTAFVGGGIQQYRESIALWNGGKAHQEFLERSFEDACELCDKLDLDLVRTVYWRKSETPAGRIDEHTFLYGEKTGDWDIWRFDPPTETYGVVERNARPRPDVSDLRREAERAVAAAEEYAPSPETFTPLPETVGRFRGRRAVPGTGVGISVPREEEWLAATTLYPDIVGTYLDSRVERATKNARVMIGLGIPYCFGGGDFAGNHGPFYSPATFHELMLPRLQRISRACHDVGCRHLFASDGNLWPVADDLFGDSGVDGFYEVDRNFMSIPELRSRFPHLVLLGGIRSEVLHTGTEQDVREETRSAVEQAVKAGGCIVGCSNQIVAGTPEANFYAMMEELEARR